MFLLHPIKPTDFFENGKPVDMLALQPDVANVEDTIMPYIYLNNTMLLAKYFDKRENMKKQQVPIFTSDILPCTLDIIFWKWHFHDLPVFTPFMARLL